MLDSDVSSAPNQHLHRPTPPGQRGGNDNTSPTGTSGAQRSVPVKPKLRNSAERRASHNAVERQRRENLNGRFLDLAAMLPNLTHIRRPTKSSIVNSTIAHVHASRRHRSYASQQVRTLQEECDSLRREVNEWRDHAGVGIVLGAPDRGEAFAMVLAGAELEFEDGDLQSGEGEEDEEGDEYGSMPAQYTQEAVEIIRHHPFQHPHAHAHELDSPFAHNISPPGSSHSLGAPAIPWYDDQTFAPHSAHEPIMSHPYLVRPPSQMHPHRYDAPPPEPFIAFRAAPYDHQGHHDPVYPQLHEQQVPPHDDPQEWLFIDESRPGGQARRPHRQHTW
ncbi:hypothetical protein DFH07DRAFT_803942 [Mycena maculata]|uniref:BHLH domain-containing protein n=1 Tax=Mycena maculata TaxID=230809 RepID=A0AAD7JSX6_9AGAR|nr:hypothetical protein DFH07DRAFT_803942 [Mycena maculata]